MNSCHLYGTTFDISWKRFEKVEDPDGRPMQDVSADTLKLVLSEVLRDLRKADRCYVKYELKTGLFPHNGALSMFRYFIYLSFDGTNYHAGRSSRTERVCRKR